MDVEMDWSIESSNAASQEVFTISVRDNPYTEFFVNLIEITADSDSIVAH